MKFSFVFNMAAGALNIACMPEAINNMAKNGIEFLPLTFVLLNLSVGCFCFMIAFDCITRTIKD